MLTFSPLESLLGGVLLFLSTSYLLKLDGEIFGVSGIFENAIHASGQKRQTAWSVLIGLSAGGVVARALTMAPSQEGATGGSTAAWILCGAVVGFGSRLGSGCTSGHLLCGVSRGSPRSMVASAIFCTTAMLTAFLLRGARQPVEWISPTLAMLQPAARTLAAAVGNFEILRLLGNLKGEKNGKPGWFRNTLVLGASISSGFWFAIGLFLSGMLNPAKVLGFLDISSIHTWDPSLVMLIIGGLLPNAIAYHLYIKNSKPVLTDRLSITTKRDIDWQLIVGAAIFGVGWGWMGVCPASAWVTLVATPGWKTIGFGAGWVMGMEVSRLVKGEPSSVVA